MPSASFVSLAVLFVMLVLTFAIMVDPFTNIAPILATNDIALVSYAAILTTPDDGFTNDATPFTDCRVPSPPPQTAGGSPSALTASTGAATAGASSTAPLRLRDPLA
jgi:hypothetical protein